MKLTIDQLNALLPLSGMTYHGGKSLEHWEELTGIDPRTVYGVTVRNSKCYLSPGVANALSRYFAAYRADRYRCTGVR